MDMQIFSLKDRDLFVSSLSRADLYHEVQEKLFEFRSLKGSSSAMSLKSSVGPLEIRELLIWIRANDPDLSSRIKASIN